MKIINLDHTKQCMHIIFLWVDLKQLSTNNKNVFILNYKLTSLLINRCCKHNLCIPTVLQLQKKVLPYLFSWSSGYPKWNKTELTLESVLKANHTNTVRETLVNCLKLLHRFLSTRVEPQHKLTTLSAAESKLSPRAALPSFLPTQYRNSLHAVNERTPLRCCLNNWTTSLVFKRFNSDLNCNLLVFNIKSYLEWYTQLK